MGYTHSWTPKTIMPLMWKRVSKDFAALFEAAKADGYKLAREYDEPEFPPLIDLDHIQFNGIGNEGHETFWIDRVGHTWSFCKTNRKPYDAVVVAALCYLARTQGYEVGSDGEAADWQDGLALAKSVWPGVDIKLPNGIE